MNNFKLNRNKMFGNTIEFESNGTTQEFMYGISDKIADIIEELQEENKQLKERIAYLERSNNRREDEIILLRDELIPTIKEEELKEKYLNAVADYEQEKAKNSKAIEITKNLLKTEDKGYYQIIFKKQLNILEGNNE